VILRKIIGGQRLSPEKVPFKPNPMGRDREGGLAKPEGSSDGDPLTESAVR